MSFFKEKKDRKNEEKRMKEYNDCFVQTSPENILGNI